MANWDITQSSFSLHFIGQTCVARLVWNWSYFSDHKALVSSKSIRLVAKQSRRVMFFHEILSSYLSPAGCVT